MIIEPLSRENVEAVVQLWSQNWIEHSDAPPTSADRERLQRVVRGYVASPQAGCFVARDGGEVVGFVTAAVSSHPVMEGMLGTVEELYVRPASRRQSAGSQLARAAMAFLRERGADVLKAHADSENAAARAFWTTLGWETDTITFSWYDLP